MALNCHCIIDVVAVPGNLSTESNTDFFVGKSVLSLKSLIRSYTLGVLGHVGMVDLISLAGNFLLFTLVFGMSATVDISCMKQQITNYRAILTGMFCQFIVLPLLGFMVVRTIGLDHGMGITLLVVTSSPGGSYSNWYVCQ